MLRALLALLVLFDTSIVANAQVQSRDVCSKRSTLVWRDNRVAVTTEEFMRIVGPRGTVTAPNCGCIDARIACEAMGQADCDGMMPECNRALNGGGQFCMRNRSGGQTCY
jgi:hypothetical protein